MYTTLKSKEKIPFQRSVTLTGSFVYFLTLPNCDILLKQLKPFLDGFSLKLNKQRLGKMFNLL
jgi:hypothetical protein